MGKRRIVKLSNDAIEITFEEAFNEFISIKEAENKAASTIRNYRQSYTYFCKANDITSETEAKEIDQKMVYKWIGKMKKEEISPASQNHYLRDLRVILYYCMDKEYIPDQFKVAQVEAQEEPLKMYCEEDLEKLLVKPANKRDFVEWRTWGVVNWICATGNRASTVCDVKLKDISFNNKEIALHHTKNKKTQNIPLSPSLETAMKEYIRMFRPNASGEAYLFPNIADEKMTYNALRLAFERYCKDRGVEKSNLHGLRHNFAKNYIKRGGNVFKLQQILGHSSIAMTRRYVALFGEDLKEGFEDYSLLDTMKKSQKRTKKI